MIETLAPLVVYLHGPSGCPADFDAVAGRLPERFSCLSPPVSWEGASPRERATRLDEELRGEGRPLLLVASAHAACVALEIARRDRVRVRGLVLSGCSDDPRDGFGKADVPVLLLWGTEDTVTPPRSGAGCGTRCPRLGSSSSRVRGTSRWSSVRRSSPSTSPRS